MTSGATKMTASPNLIEQLRHACSVACGDLLALGMPVQASTGKLLLEAIAAAEAHLHAPVSTPTPVITAEPEAHSARLTRLQHAVIAAAKAWRTTPPCDDTTSTAPWVGALRRMEQAIDDLINWSGGT